MADALLASGATVAIASRPGDRLATAVKQHHARGLDAVPLPVDVREPASVAEAADRAFETLGGIDLLVNNAGIGMRTVNPRFLDAPMPFFEVSPEGFADLISTNLTGYFLMAREFAPKMIDQGFGRIVNVSMNYATMRRRGFVPYGPSRAATESLSLIMAEDLHSYGIAVNQLLPGGATDTGMIPEETPSKVKRQLLPARIMGPPIVFLASEEATGLTGERLIAKDFDSWLAAYRSGGAFGSTASRKG